MDRGTLRGGEVLSEAAWHLFRPVCSTGESHAVTELLRWLLGAWSMPCHEQHAEHTATWSKRRLGFPAAHAGPGVLGQSIDQGTHGREEQ